MTGDAMWGMIGVIVGWLLSTISERMGKIKIEISNHDVSFEKKGKEIFEEEVIDYREKPDYIKISINLSAYNNYSKCNSINIIGYSLVTNRNEYCLNASLNGLESFLNIEPYKFIAGHLYHLDNCHIPKEAVESIGSGYEIYLKYKINNGKITRKKLIEKK